MCAYICKYYICVFAYSRPCVFVLVVVRVCVCASECACTRLCVCARVYVNTYPHIWAQTSAREGIVLMGHNSCILHYRRIWRVLSHRPRLGLKSLVCVSVLVWWFSFVCFVFWGLGDLLTVSNSHGVCLFIYLFIYCLINWLSHVFIRYLFSDRFN